MLGRVRICLLSRNPGAYSTQRLVAAAQARRHSVLVVDYPRCHCLLGSVPLVVYGGHALAGFDCVLPRIASGPEAAWGAAIVGQFETMGVAALNAGQGILCAADKARALQALVGAGLPVPRTAIGHASADKDLLLQEVGGPPVLLKPLFGTQGAGIKLGKTRQAAERTIAARQQAGSNFMLQEFIAEAGGKDLRLIVLAGRVIAAMQRVAQPGEFRSNLHRGGTSLPVQPSAAEKRLARRAAAAVGLQFAGVDLIRSRRGPLLLEVNASPGLEGIEATTGVDIAGKVICAMERQCGT